MVRLPQLRSLPSLLAANSQTGACPSGFKYTGYRLCDCDRASLTRYSAATRLTAPATLGSDPPFTDCATASTILAASSFTATRENTACHFGTDATRGHTADGARRSGLGCVIYRLRDRGYYFACIVVFLFGNPREHRLSLGKPTPSALHALVPLVQQALAWTVEAPAE